MFNNSFAVTDRRKVNRQPSGFPEAIDLLVNMYIMINGYLFILRPDRPKMNNRNRTLF